MKTNENDHNYVLEAFDYNFIIIISQRRSKRRDQFKYAKISRKVTKNMFMLPWSSNFVSGKHIQKDIMLSITGYRSFHTSRLNNHPILSYNILIETHRELLCFFLKSSIIGKIFTAISKTADV